MNQSQKRIAFKIEFSRILELLSDQIYQSPLALLRENIQNAFDAVLIRQSEIGNFQPRIDISIDEHTISVSDNGIGMSAQDIETHFWFAGRSGKNTDAARAAGVVGTFGIGALANFGIVDELTVVSESARIEQRTRSSVHKSELSTDTKGIVVEPEYPTGSPGTTVTARLADAGQIDLEQAREYIRGFVHYLQIPVYFNGDSLSGANHRDALPSERYAWSEAVASISLSQLVSGNLEILGMASGELRVVLDDIEIAEPVGVAGAIVLTQNRNTIQTLRSGFGLATVAIHSRYNWGGIIDLPLLKPTAGREALDSISNQLLHDIVRALDDVVSSIAVKHTESFSNEAFLQWIVETQQFSLCGDLEVTVRPSGTTETLRSANARGGLQYYSGRDQSIIQTYASEDEPLIVISRRNPRRNCEVGYLTRNGIREVDTQPRVTQELALGEQGLAHSALAVRISRVLEDDYFLGVDVRFGTLTGGLSVLVTRTELPVEIYLDPDTTSVAPLLALYREDFDAFGPFVKDFVRASIFPRISSLVPSSTREGAEAFLRHLRSNREWFEYELDDKANLEEILEEFRSGRLTFADATRRIADTSRSVVEVSSAGAVPLSSIVGTLENEGNESAVEEPFVARPSIDRRNEQTDALILTSESPVLNGYTCFLGLSSRVQRDRGEFFLHPHSTEVVWGGTKVVFIFQHHSKRFGPYYDILFPGLVSDAAGGGPRVTSTILTENRTFIPIPMEIVDGFLPEAGERKRLEVRCDILYLAENQNLPG